MVGYTLKGGLSLFGHRYYNSAGRRFTAPDPTYQERNRYAYGKSDPINNTDPIGAYSTDDFEDDLGVVANFGGAGAAIGGGVGLIACVVGPVGCATGAGVGAGVGLGAVSGIARVRHGLPAGASHMGHRCCSTAGGLLGREDRWIGRGSRCCWQGGATATSVLRWVGAAGGSSTSKPGLPRRVRGTIDR
ncbi:RHS repeat-associated core domain-containing protein [Actinosynnema sp. CS-041913]|uniref:RHS repeat-associated core domain-containing protein n=1 Tax=Actinosynnema sp. CS-041913 TaxID=3239917 RepID=UPI003D8F2294